MGRYPRFPGDWIEEKLIRGVETLLGLLLGLLITQGLPFIFNLISGLFQLIMALVEWLISLAERITGRPLRHSLVATTLAAGFVVTFVVVPAGVVILLTLGTLMEVVTIALVDTATTVRVLAVSFLVGAGGGLLLSLSNPLPYQSRGHPVQRRRASAPAPWQGAFDGVDLTSQSSPWAGIFSTNGAHADEERPAWEGVFGSNGVEEPDEELAWSGVFDGFVVGDELDSPWW